MPNCSVRATVFGRGEPMKIKLNMKQVTDIMREIKETDRKTFDLSDVSEVFQMLKYWAKSAGTGDEKIKTITELPDGYLCRVNEKFHDSMKEYLKQSRMRRFSEQIKEVRAHETIVKAQETIEKYDRLIKEAEERKGYKNQPNSSSFQGRE
jgi:hypothetical protein